VKVYAPNATIGKRRRHAANASWVRVASFSAISNSSRACLHSPADTTCGIATLSSLARAGTHCFKTLKAVNPKPARRLDEGLKCFTEATSCEADRQLSMTHALVTARDLSSSAMSALMRLMNRLDA